MSEHLSGLFLPFQPAILPSGFGNGVPTTMP